jgi:hypothetical protein
MKENSAKQVSEDALVKASEKQLEKSPKAVGESTDDLRVPEHTGIVHSGGNECHDSPVQPLADTEHGAQDARERKSESPVTSGHHVQAGGDPDGNRQAFVESEYARTDSKVRGDSNRKTYKETFAKAKKL